MGPYGRLTCCPGAACSETSDPVPAVKLESIARAILRHIGTLSKAWGKHPLADK